MLYGSSLGGDRIIISSDCFLDSSIQDMQCNFGGILVDGMPFEINSYICISPPRFSRDSNQLTLRVRFGGFYFDHQEIFEYNEQICSLSTSSSKSVRLNNTFARIGAVTVVDTV